MRIFSFTSSPEFSIARQEVTLSWQTENATSVVLTGNGISPQTLPVNGSFVVTSVRDHNVHPDGLRGRRADRHRQHHRARPVTGGRIEQHRGPKVSDPTDVGPILPGPRPFYIPGVAALTLARAAKTGIICG